MKTLNIDNLIDLYATGLSITKLSKKLGFDRGRLKRELVKANVKIRSRTESIEASAAVHFTPDVVADLRQRYEAGASLKELERITRRKADTIGRYLRKDGVAMRSGAEATRLANARKLTPAEVSGIVDGYKAGTSIAQLSLDFGYCPGQFASKRYPHGTGIRGALHREGVELRTIDTSSQDWWDARPSEEERRALMRPTHVGAAQARAKSGQVLTSPAENIIFGALSMGPHTWVQQRAVDVYNLDISMEELPIAVEVEGGSAFASKRKASAYQRIKYLTDHDWLVLYVVLGRPGLRDPATVAKEIHTAVDRARADKSFFGKYGVIDGEGRRRTGARHNPDGVPLVAGFGSGSDPALHGVPR